MKRRGLALGVALVAALTVVGVAAAQSGHFLNNTSCTEGTTSVSCNYSVAGLGSTTFEVRIAAQGVATVTCTNPGGNIAPGQDTSITATGTTGPQPTPRNGRVNGSISTNPITVPNTPTCPNASWTATVTSVNFSSVTLTLLEGGVVADTFTQSL
jgi:hypothetical protein